jgi:TusA-related sulfurtransferase
MQQNSDLEIDGRKKSCTGLIAELEKAMKDSSVSSISVIAQDVPTKIDIYAWAKRKGHTVSSDSSGQGMIRMQVLR